MNSFWVVSLCLNTWFAPADVCFILVFAFGRCASSYYFRLRTLCFILFFRFRALSFVKFTSDPDVMLDFFFSSSVAMLKDSVFRPGRYASWYYFCLRTLCFIISIAPPEVMLHYILHGSDVMLCHIFPRPDVLLHHICSASGCYASWFCSPPDVMPDVCFRICYYYMVRASGCYLLSSDVLLMSLSLIIWCSLPAAIASGRYHSSSDSLRPLSFIIWCSLADAIIYYVMFVFGRYHFLYLMFASGHYHLSFYVLQDAIIHHMVRASGR